MSHIIKIYFIDVFRRGGDKRLQPPKMVQIIKEIAALARQSNQETIQPQRPDVVDPPESIRDKIKFNINNLSKAYVS